MSNKYNYRPITINFDLDDDLDKKIIKWLEEHKTKKNNYSNQIRTALKEYIERNED